MYVMVSLCVVVLLFSRGVDVCSGVDVCGGVDV